MTLPRMAAVMVIILLSLSLFSTAVDAQETVQITSSDCVTQFPTCEVYVDGTTADAVSGVAVDGQPISPFEMKPIPRGAMVAFAFDEFVVPQGTQGYSVRQAGTSGEPKYREFWQTAIQFYDLAKAPELQDHIWLSAIKSGEPAAGETTIRTFPPIIGWIDADNGGEFWVNGPQISRFFNKVQDYEPPSTKNTPVTPLVGLVQAGIDSFSTALAQERDGVTGKTPPSFVEKHLIVFSDGFREQDAGQIGSLIQAANAQNIHIHVVKLGQESQATFPLFGQLTAGTGGLSPISYTALADVAPLWEEITRDLDQLAITFSLTDFNADQVQITVGAETIVGTLELPALSQPQASVNLERNQIEIVPGTPITLPIQMRFAFPDGYGLATGRISCVRYRMGVHTFDAKADGVDVPSSTITAYLQLDQIFSVGESGDYRIEPEFCDQTGTVTLAALPLSVTINEPQEVTSSAELTPTDVVSANVASATVTPTPPGPEDPYQRLKAIWGRYQLPIIAGAGGLLLLMFLLANLRSRNDGNIITSGGLEHTEMDESTEMDISADPFPVATLIRMSEDNTLPKQIELRRYGERNEWPIGRDYQRCQHGAVLNSKRISKKHATIIEENGIFQIRDEGSSNGTYVTSADAGSRERLIPMVEAPLHDQDIINFNTFAYQLKVDLAYVDNDATEMDEGDDTEFS